MSQTWKRHGVGALVTCTFVVLVLMGTASGFINRQKIYVNCPSTTVAAGVQVVNPGGEVVITGVCPEALTIDKPLTLQAQGSETVLIGPGVGGGTPAPPLPDSSLIYELIAEWSDPLTPPQSRTSCIGWFEWGELKTCSEWKTEWRHMINRLYIRIDDDFGVDAQQVHQCFQEALISGAVSGIAAAAVTGGVALPAAIESFVQTFSWCVWTDFIGFGDISFPTWSGWSDWE